MTNLRSFIKSLFKPIQKQSLSVQPSNQQQYYEMAIENELRIINDCLALIKSSNNFETVLSRFQVGIDAACRLKKMEQAGYGHINFTSEGFLAILTHDRETLLLDAINRVYQDMLEKSSYLKTESGKINRRKKLIATLRTYQNNLPQSCIARINQLEQDIDSFDEELWTRKI